MEGAIYVRRGVHGHIYRGNWLVRQEYWMIKLAPGSFSFFWP